MEGTKR